MSLGGSVGAMIASMRQNVSMIRTANRKGLNKKVLMRGSGDGSPLAQGNKFPSTKAEQAFLAELAKSKAKADQQLRWVAIVSMSLLLLLLGWILS